MNALIYPSNRTNERDVFKTLPRTMKLLDSTMKQSYKGSKERISLIFLKQKES